MSYIICKMTAVDSMAVNFLIHETITAKNAELFTGLIEKILYS